jgi:hypothetical protein
MKEVYLVAKKVGARAVEKVVMSESLRAATMDGILVVMKAGKSVSWSAAKKVVEWAVVSVDTKELLLVAMKVASTAVYLVDLSVLLQVVQLAVLMELDLVVKWGGRKVASTAVHWVVNLAGGMAGLMAAALVDSWEPLWAVKMAVRMAA